MTVRVSWINQIVLITIDRPERRNALDHPTLVALVAAQREAAAGGARCVVVTGAPPAFSAGADLTGVEGDEFASALGAALTGFTRLPIPVIAAVDGPALGAGTQLALACDLRVATPTSRFGIPAAKLGLSIDMWTIDKMRDQFGGPVARDMLLAASTYPASELSGFVHRLGNLDVALAWASELVRLAPLTIAAHKLGLEGADGFESARRAAWASADSEEGRTAFLEKRSPRFTGY